MADSFKNLTAYYYMAHVMGRPDLLPVIIMAGLVSPLAMQPVIPRLLKLARKENLIIFGLFAAACSSVLMLAAGTRPAALCACVVLYGVFTSIVANLVYAVTSSFADEIRERQGISISEIITAAMNLSSNLGAGVAGGVSALAMAWFGYSAQSPVQTAASLSGFRALYIFCTAAFMALAGLVMVLFRKQYHPHPPRRYKSHNIGKH